MIQKVDATSVGNVPNNTPEQIEKAQADMDAKKLVESEKPYEEMSAEERAIYNAWKEEHDDEFLKAVGRGSSDVLRVQPPSPTTPPANSYLKSVPTKPSGPYPLSSREPIPQSQVERPTIAPRPPVNKPNSPFSVSAVKDELTVPFAEVARFVTSVMGTDFGYISKEMAKSIIALIPKEAALLAISTSKEDAMKFLDHADKTIRKEAIKKYFNVTDDATEVVENLLDTPGFEINPWKR